MSAFFSMNGYGFYIWSAYGVAALAIVVELFVLRSRRKTVLGVARSFAPDPARDATETGA